MELNVARWLERSEANGPGTRFVLWVQGCSLHCPGCWNPDTWSHSPRVATTVEAVWQAIYSVDGLEGISISGGEPFEQAAACAMLAELAQAAGLSVLAYTGKSLATLQLPEHERLLASVDILVAGPFVASQVVTGEPLLGSANQTIHFLTSRYSQADLQGLPVSEVLIRPDGTIIYTGFTEPGLRD